MEQVQVQVERPVEPEVILPIEFIDEVGLEVDVEAAELAWLGRESAGFDPSNPLASFKASNVIAFIVTLIWLMNGRLAAVI